MRLPTSCLRRCLFGCSRRSLNHLLSSDDYRKSYHILSRFDALVTKSTPSPRLPSCSTKLSKGVVVERDFIFLTSHWLVLGVIRGSEHKGVLGSQMLCSITARFLREQGDSHQVSPDGLHLMACPDNVCLENPPPDGPAQSPSPGPKTTTTTEQKDSSLVRPPASPLVRSSPSHQDGPLSPPSTTTIKRSPSSFGSPFPRKARVESPSTASVPASAAAIPPAPTMTTIEDNSASEQQPPALPSATERWCLFNYSDSEDE
jgi:hypothetical protein